MGVDSSANVDEIHFLSSHQQEPLEPVSFQDIHPIMGSSGIAPDGQWCSHAHPLTFFVRPTRV